MSDVKPGKFIVVEGLDGSGKTTHISRIAQHLRERGRKVHITAEPTISLTGGMLRDALSGLTPKTPCEMAAMFVLDRIYHNVNPVSGINKMLADGYDVICDRYYYSSLAYQGSETDFEWVRTMNTACPDIRRPDLCVFLDLDPSVCVGRIAAERTTTEIYEKKEKLEKFRERYFAVFALLDDDIAVIDTSGEISDVSAEVCAAVDRVTDN